MAQSFDIKTITQRKDFPIILIILVVALFFFFCCGCSSFGSILSGDTDNGAETVASKDVAKGEVAGATEELFSVSPLVADLSESIELAKSNSIDTKAEEELLKQLNDYESLNSSQFETYSSKVAVSIEGLSLKIDQKELEIAQAELARIEAEAARVAAEKVAAEEKAKLLAASKKVAPVVQPKPVAPTYVCDCSKTCPNISSCAEAQYLLNTCGCSARDGDNDGIACDGAPLNCQ